MALSGRSCHYNFHLTIWQELSLVSDAILLLSCPSPKLNQSPLFELNSMLSGKACNNSTSRQMTRGIIMLMINTHSSRP